MQYIVDGHNLIPKVGLRLNAEDDEIQLIEMLREFCRVKKSRVDVYFDGAPPGHANTRKFGYVTAHFVRQGRTADQAIHARLRKMGKSAKNWVVVSSDHEVRTSARSVGAKRISSNEFARDVRDAKFAVYENPTDDKKLSKGEVAEWLKLFEEGDE
jgi:predicted RNA-binding protein with PIN domain